MRRRPNMKTMYKTIGVLISVVLLAACSDETSSNVPNKTPIADVDSSNEQSLSNASDALTSNLTESDSLFIDSLLNSYEPPKYIEASDMCPEDDEECLASFYDSVTVLPATPVEYGFSTKRERVYQNYILSYYGVKGDCLIEKYPLEDGARRWAQQSPSYSVKTILIRDNEESRFVHYLLDNSYGYNSNPQKDCPADSTEFANSCQAINGILTSYGDGCSARFTPVLNLMCIAKIQDSVTLDSLTASLPEECNTFVNSANINDLVPPISNVRCSYENDEVKTCDTLKIK